MYGIVKQTDNRREAALCWTQFSYDYGPNGTLINKRSSSSFEKTVGLIGSERMASFNFTRGWKPGKFAVNPIIQRSVTTSCTSGTLDLFSVYQGKTYASHVLSGELGAFLGIPPAGGSIYAGPTEDPDVGLSLHQRATASASQSEMEAGVMIGELSETLGMLANPFIGLASFLKRNPIPKKKRALRRLSQMAKAPSQELSNWWLQARFGIMPFLNDIAAIKAECQKRVSRDFNLMHSRAKKSTVQVHREPYTGYLFNVPVKGDVYQRTIHRTLATVYYNRFQWSTSERLGLHWSQIPGIMWELVPFSFLVDRVVNIGQWLEIMRPKQEFVIQGSTLSYKDESESIFHAKEALLTYGSDTRTVIDILCRTKCISYHRTIPGPLPIGPTVNLKIGGLVKTLDHLTLLNQNILRKMR